MTFEMQFIIMADAKETIESFVQSLQIELAVPSSVTPRSFDWRDNWIQVRKNDDYDEDLMSNNDDGYLYYPFRIEVSPKNNEVTIAQQVDTARLLGQAINKQGFRFVICADFEELL